jgi:hypothetical protein
MGKTHTRILISIAHGLTSENVMIPHKQSQ